MIHNRFIYHFFFLAFLQVILLSEVQSQYWMQKGGSIELDEGYDIAVDANGNTYSTGYFTNTISFGSINLTSAGARDIFVVKTNNQGVYEWAQRAGGVGDDRGLSIDINSNGDCFVTGFFTDTANFSSSQGVNSEGQQDVFIAK